VYALRPISAGEEIVVTYIELEQPYAARQEELRQKYSFDCTCSICTLPEGERRRSDVRRDLLRTMSIDIVNVDRGVELGRWLNDPSLPVDYLIKRSLPVVGMMDQEGVHPDILALVHYTILWDAYCALGDEASACKWLKRLWIAGGRVRGVVHHCERVETS
jgi:hypothetical protein